MKISHIATAVCALTTLAIVSASAGAGATTKCQAVSGTYTATQTTAGCTSPTGICFTGTISGGTKFLDGSTEWIELDQAPSAGMPLTEPGTTISYSGTLTITSGANQLTLRNLGVLDGARYVFTEIERPVGGTGIFVSASNPFFISGTMNTALTQFNGQISGSLCGVQ